LEVLAGASRSAAGSRKKLTKEERQRAGFAEPPRFLFSRFQSFRFQCSVVTSATTSLGKAELQWSETLEVKSSA